MQNLQLTTEFYISLSLSLSLSHIYIYIEDENSKYLYSQKLAGTYLIIRSWKELIIVLRRSK